MNKKREQIVKIFFKRGYSPSKELVSELVELIDSNRTDTLDEVEDAIKKEASPLSKLDAIKAINNLRAK